MMSRVTCVLIAVGGLSLLSLPGCVVRPDHDRTVVVHEGDHHEDVVHHDVDHHDDHDIHDDDHH